jgi:Flp pilus assembly protein TadG
MTWKGKPRILGFWRQTRGSVLVEFAIVGTVFLVIIAGILDFGHAWYMKQSITNASREGARYGITWRSNTSGTRVAPSTFTPTIANYVLNTSVQNGGAGGYGLNGLLPCDAAPTVTCPTATSPGYTTGNKGQAIEVKVTAVKKWFLVSGFVPGLGNQITLTASTVMLCE